jgi:S-adenosylmethionine-diacylglycerol 3-amino-3-carboxypropyl transferase
MFSFDDLYAQREYFDSKFPRWRWNLIVALLGNRQAFDALLYKGHFVKKNIDSSFYDFYKKSFDHLMRNNLMKASFFLQLCFLGEIQYSEGNPIEADKKVFENIKKNLSKCRITFVQKDLMSAIANYNDLDFISLSDVPSYFNGDLEKSFLQMIKKSLSVKGLIVNRNYLRVPEADRSGLVDIASDYQAIVDSEKVQMYLIEVLKHERKEDPTS